MLPPHLQDSASGAGGVGARRTGGSTPRWSLRRAARTSLESMPQQLATRPCERRRPNGASRRVVCRVVTTRRATRDTTIAVQARLPRPAAMEALPPRPAAMEKSLLPAMEEGLPPASGPNGSWRACSAPFVWRHLTIRTPCHARTPFATSASISGRGRPATSIAHCASCPSSGATSCPTTRSLISWQSSSCDL